MAYLHNSGHGPKPSKKQLVHGAVPTQNLPVKSSDFFIAKPEKKGTKASIYCTGKNISFHNNVLQESYRTGQQSEKACVKWLVCIICTENAVRIWKVDIPFIVPTYDIQIDDSLGFTLIVHGWFIPEDHIIYKNNKRSLRNITVSYLIKEIVQLKVCVGHKGCFHR